MDIARLLEKRGFVSNEPSSMDRRGFLKATALAGGGMTLAWMLPGAAVSAEEAQQGQAKKVWNPNAFIKINKDNTVEIQVNRQDFGQGALTSLPMLIAEELDVEWKNVRSMLAPAGEPYKDPLYGIQLTGGSMAVAHSWEQYRSMGAALKEMLVQAAAKQWNVPVSEVKAQMGVVTAGSKSATYGELAEAASTLPIPEKPALKNPSDYRLIGKPTRRIDAPAIARGEKTFGIDAKAKGQVVALIAHPPTFNGGKVAKYDAKKALAIKGVKAVLEVPTDRGGTGLAVIADSFWPAKQGRDALEITWTPGESAGVSTDKLMQEYKAEAKNPKVLALDWSNGGTREALEGASKKIVAEYEFPYLAHAPMEPVNCVVDLKKDRCTVWVGSQFQTIDQMNVAAVAGLKPEQVTLITMAAGGGFGRRAVPSSDYVKEAVGVAKAWGKGPVKVMWTREDDIKGGYYRPAHVHRVEVGLDDSGKVVAWDHGIVGQSILAGTPFEQFLVKNGVDGTMTEGVVDNRYDMPMRVRITHPSVPVPPLWWRSVGHTHTGYVMETMVDEVARTANSDPVEFRRQQFGDKHPRHLAALNLAVEKSGYGKRKLPEGRAYGIAVHESFNSVVAYVLEASIADNKPVIHSVTAGVDCGRVVNPMTAVAQIQGGVIYGLSQTMPGNEITLKDGQVQQSQFSDFTPPRITDAQFPVDVHFVQSDAPPTGLGEPGVPPLAPALANAVAALTGKRLRKLPFDLTA